MPSGTEMQKAITKLIVISSMVIGRTRAISSDTLAPVTQERPRSPWSSPDDPGMTPR